MVFAGIYPVETSEFEELRASMEKLQLNDASLVWELETSAALALVSVVDFWACSTWRSFRNG